MRGRHVPVLAGAAALGLSLVLATTRAALLLAMGNGLELVRMFAPELVPLDVMEASLRRVVTDHED